MLKIFGPLVFAIILSSCSKNNLPEYISLGDLRILTMIVDTPEINPGTAVNITPVISDLNGGGRSLNYNIYGCVDPGTGVGAAASCAHPDAATVSSGTIPAATSAASTYTGSVASFAIPASVTTSILLGRSAAQQYNGVAYLVFYELSVPGTATSVTAFVRIVVTTALKTTKNTNPVIQSIDMNDNAVGATTALPVGATNFRATSPDGSSETYFVQQKDGSQTSTQEQLITTWFISLGSFDFYRTLGNGENSWSPPASLPVGHGVVILAVTRDGRGGAAFQKVEFN